MNGRDEHGDEVKRVGEISKESRVLMARSCEDGDQSVAYWHVYMHG